MYILYSGGWERRIVSLRLAQTPQWDPGSNKQIKVERWEKHYYRLTINYNPHKNDILAVGQVNTFQGKTIQMTLTLSELIFYYKLSGNWGVASADPSETSEYVPPTHSGLLETLLCFSNLCVSVLSVCTHMLIKRTQGIIPQTLYTVFFLLLFFSCFGSRVSHWFGSYQNRLGQPASKRQGLPVSTSLVLGGGGGVPYYYAWLI